MNKKVLPALAAAVLALSLSAALVISERQNHRDDMMTDGIVLQKPHIPAQMTGTLIDEGADARPAMDFYALREQNRDIVAWITIEGTSIDFPVTQGTDNDFYLHHDAYGNKNRNGSLFLDYRNDGDFSGCNSIIYGHNMKSGKMLEPLLLFKEADYFAGHTTGFLYTPDKTYQLEAALVAVVPSDGAAYTWAFESETAWESYISEMNAYASISNDIELPWGARVVTLSTCSYEYKDARTILVLKICG